MRDLPRSTTPPSQVCTALEDEAREYITASRSANTVRGYASDWRDFNAWCQAHGRSALPADPETVTLYVTDLSHRLKTSTIRRRLSSISVAHQAAGHPSPTADVLVRSAWAGIQRIKGTAETPKAALLTADIRAMVSQLPEHLAGDRDRCLLLIGFAGALRRSELVGLDVEDIDDTTDGPLVTIRRSKTDQKGRGRMIGIPYGAHPATCPVRAFRRYVTRSQVDSGPPFRAVDRHGNIGSQRLSDRSVALIVKRSAAAVGVDPAVVAGHSLRSGMATSAATSGASESEIMNVTGHRSVQVLRRYIRRGTIWEANASAKLGL